MRVRSLVEGLLDFARAGGAPGSAHCDVARVLADVVAELNEQADATHATIEVGRVEGTVACSPGVLYSILSNLINNALKYLGESHERRVSVRSAQRGARVLVEVEDTGRGVPTALRQHIFEPFARGPSSDGSAGHGLGLATVKRLVSAHGGKVGVRALDGRGSIFWFELPAAPELATAPHAPM
jgi:signal transduction histidine kinase